MSTLFDACFSIVLGEEGGYTTDPADPGGETNWGISKRAYPALNIKTLTQDQAKAIYLRDYWMACDCQNLPAALALIVFDAAVNNGQERAREWLQAAVGVATDGVIGAQTVAALARALADPATNVAAEFLARRIDCMASLKNWSAFGLGWSRRLAGLPFAAMKLAVEFK